MKIENSNIAQQNYFRSFTLYLKVVNRIKMKIKPAPPDVLLSNVIIRLLLHFRKIFGIKMSQHYTL